MDICFHYLRVSSRDFININMITKAVYIWNFKRTYYHVNFRCLYHIKYCSGNNVYTSIIILKWKLYIIKLFYLELNVNQDWETISHKLIENGPINRQLPHITIFSWRYKLKYIQDCKSARSMAFISHAITNIMHNTCRNQ